MNKLLVVLITFFIMVSLLSCAEHTPIKNSPALNAKAISQEYSGHINTLQNVDGASSVSIVSCSNDCGLALESKNDQQELLYSFSAVDSDVKDALYHLAEQTNYQIDIWQGVAGQLTIHALHQPLRLILERIGEQLDLNINVHNDQIIVKPDVAYWKPYKVDYVNITRSRSDSIVMNMTVGGSITPTVGGQSTGSKSSINVSSEHDFWAGLRATLLSIVNYSHASAQLGLVNSPVSKVSMHAPDSSMSVPVVVNPEAGLVLVYAVEKRQLQVQNYLDMVMERVDRQVLIEASVVEVVLFKQHQLGIDWSNTGFKNLSNRRLLMGASGAVPLADNIFTADLGNSVGVDFILGLKMLEQFGDVQVLSSPKIMAINNQSALLKVVDNQVYFTVNVSRSTSTAGTDVTYSTTVHTVPVGFMMSMTPFVNDKREITLNIRPTISRIIGSVLDPNPDLKTVGVESQIPVVQEREIETVLKLRDQQTAVIGGLIEDRQDKLDSGVPWLSRIPWLGKWLFGYKEAGTTKTELVIFIRPIIVDRPDIDDGDLTQFSQFLRPNNHLHYD